MKGTNLNIPVKGEIRGTAEVRDKHGNLKGTFTFAGPATEEQFKELQKATGLGDAHGSDTDRRRA